MPAPVGRDVPPVRNRSVPSNDRIGRCSFAKSPALAQGFRRPLGSSLGHALSCRPASCQLLQKILHFGRLTACANQSRTTYSVLDLFLRQSAGGEETMLTKK